MNGVRRRALTGSRNRVQERCQECWLMALCEMTGVQAECGTTALMEARKPWFGEQARA